MFVGAYWSQRKEPVESAAERVATFLTALSQQEGASFSKWYRKGKSRALALGLPITLDVATIARELKRNRRDVDREPIPELGFEFTAWNGQSASFSVRVGACSRHVRNAVVLNVVDGEGLSEGSYRVVIEEMVRVFDPDHAVVTSHERLASAGVANPWEAGMFTYHRGGAIEAHPFE